MFATVLSNETCICLIIVLQLLIHIEGICCNLFNIGCIVFFLCVVFNRHLCLCSFGILFFFFFRVEIGCLFETLFCLLFVLGYQFVWDIIYALPLFCQMKLVFVCFFVLRLDCCFEILICFCFFGLEI